MQITTPSTADMQTFLFLISNTIIQDYLNTQILPCIAWQKVISFKQILNKIS